MTPFNGSCEIEDFALEANGPFSCLNGYKNPDKMLVIVRDYDYCYVDIEFCDGWSADYALSDWARMHLSEII